MLPHAPRHTHLRRSRSQEGSTDEAEGSEAAEGAASGAADGGDQPPGASRPSFWGVASALTATVKARTAEVLIAVQETDWRAELEAFQQARGCWPPPA